MNKLEINAIILSAGLSGRMKMFKPLANYKGKTFLNNIIIKLDKICNEINIVTGFNSVELKTEIIKSLKKENQSEVVNKIKFVFNESFQKGMFTSLQIGISKAKNCEWLLYHFVDQPGLPEKFYTEFIKKIDYEHNWIQPAKGKRKGHPILINKTLFDLILNSYAQTSLREISKNPVVKKKFWDCEFEEILQDIDTDQDYRKL